MDRPIATSHPESVEMFNAGRRLRADSQRHIEAHERLERLEERDAPEPRIASAKRRLKWATQDLDASEEAFTSLLDDVAGPDPARATYLYNLIFTD